MSLTPRGNPADCEHEQESAASITFETNCVLFEMGQFEHPQFWHGGVQGRPAPQKVLQFALWPPPPPPPPPPPGTPVEVHCW